MCHSFLNVPCIKDVRYFPYIFLYDMEEVNQVPSVMKAWDNFGEKYHFGESNSIPVRFPSPSSLQALHCNKVLFMEFLLSDIGSKSLTKTLHFGISVPLVD